MCLRVFSEGNNAMFDELSYATRLGSVLKVNFLRDIPADYSRFVMKLFSRCRHQSVECEQKAGSRKSIETDSEALKGIKQQP
jgi:hypothetical protein